MKTTIAVFLVGCLAGALLMKYLTPRPQAAIATLTDTKVKIVKVTEPSGKVVETVEKVKHTKNISNPPTPQHKYGIGVLSDKAILAEARIGDLPLFIMVQTNLTDHRIGVKWEF